MHIGLLFDFCWRSLRLRLKISVHFLFPVPRSLSLRVIQESNRIAIIPIQIMFAIYKFFVRARHPQSLHV